MSFHVPQWAFVQTRLEEGGLLPRCRTEQFVGQVGQLHWLHGSVPGADCLKRGQEEQQADRYAKEQACSGQNNREWHCCVSEGVSGAGRFPDQP